jgi:purine nucleosidase
MNYTIVNRTRVSTFAIAMFVTIGATTVMGCSASTDDVALADEALHGSAIPVVFDTDMDFDDAMALAYLCQEHKLGRIDLRAVTVVNNGAGLPGSAIRHARCVLDACGLSNIPVADGSPVGAQAAPPELQFVVETVLEGALQGCTASTEPAARTAPELLVDVIRNSRQRVVLLTTGPLTNVASALDAPGRPPLHSRIASVYVMGGAIDVPGNLIGTGSEAFDGTQELNVWIDPEAMTRVLTDLRRVYLVPLDATQYVPATFEFATLLSENANTAEAQLVSAVLSQPIVQYGMSLGAFYFWDPLTAMAATGHAGVVEFERDRISVIEEGTAAGRTVSSRRGESVFVGMSSDRTRFEHVFLRVLNGEQPLRRGRH